LKSTNTFPLFAKASPTIALQQRLQLFILRLDPTLRD
jgi:hypothetical protein